MYIRLWSLSEKYDKTVCLIKKDEHYLYVCQPLCFEWIYYIGEQGKMKEIHLEKKRRGRYSYIKEEMEKNKQEHWFYQCKMDEINIMHLNEISTFFQELMDKEEVSIVKKIEKAICLSEETLPKEVMRYLLRYTLNYFKYHPERLRLLFSVKVKQYL